MDTFDLKKYLANNILLKEDEKSDLKKSFQKVCLNLIFIKPGLAIEIESMKRSFFFLIQL